MTWFQVILGAILGTGGIGGVIAALHARKSKKAGVPADENEAHAVIAATAIPAPATAPPMPAVGPEWSRFNKYWLNEITSLKAEVIALRAEVAKCQEAAAKQARDDAEHIDALEEQIWLGLPPPPRKRKQPGG